MDKFIVCVALLLVGCVRDPYVVPVEYAQDDLWCWHLEQDGKWHVKGLNHDCPTGTRYVSPLDLQSDHQNLKTK